MRRSGRVASTSRVRVVQRRACPPRRDRAGARRSRGAPGRSGAGRRSGRAATRVHPVPPARSGGRRSPAATGPRGRRRRRPRAARRGRRRRAGGVGGRAGLDAAGRGRCRGGTAPADGSPRPARRARRDRRDPRRRGRGGGQPVRPRPVRDVPGVRLTTRVEGGHAVDRRQRPRGPQRGDVLGAGRRGVAAVQVRGRHASGAAGARDGEPGAHPHLVGDGARAAGGRRGRGGHRRQGPPGRCVPVQRAGRAERQHDRLGRTGHPPPDGDRRVDAGRAQPAAEPGQGDAGAARPTARGRRA